MNRVKMENIYMVKKKRSRLDVASMSSNQIAPEPLLVYLVKSTLLSMYPMPSTVDLSDGRDQPILHLDI